MRSRIYYNRNRKRIRLPNYNYSKAGAYFITIYIHDRECLFGNVTGGKVILSELGKLAHDCWVQIPQHFAGVELDEYIVMPNHVHGIIIIHDSMGNDSGGENVMNAIALRTNINDRTKMLIPKIIQQYKAAVTRAYNLSPNHPPFRWQKSYYDHIIRNPFSFARIRWYIRNNPRQWQNDIENL